MDNKQKRYLVLSLLLLVVVVCGGLLFNYINRKDERSYHKLTSNLQSYWLHNDDVYYYTGSFFAKYNLKNDSITQLSDYLFINSGINSVNWQDTSVVFQTNPQGSDIDDVTVASKNLGVKPDIPHWWKYDFNLKQYQLLNFDNIDSCTILVQINPQLLACTQPGELGNYSTKVLLFDLSKRSAKTIVSSDNTISNLSFFNNQLVYQQTSLGGKDSLYDIDLNTLKGHLVYKSDANIAQYEVGNNNTILVNEITRDNKSTSGKTNETEAQTNLSQKIKLLKDGKTVVDSGAGGYPINLYKDLGGNTLFSSLDGSVNSVNEKGVQQLYRPTKETLGPESYLFTNNRQVYYIDQKNDFYSTKKITQPNNYRLESAFNFSSDNDPNGRFWLDKSENGKRGVYLFTPNTNSTQQQKLVGDYLSGKGFKPSEFSFSWVIGDDSISINPQAVVVR